MPGVLIVAVSPKAASTMSQPSAPTSPRNSKGALFESSSDWIWSVPLGQYDDEKLLNIGTNRWSFKPELGVAKALGPVTLEVAPSVTFYTDNDDFFGGTRRSQDPRYAVQAHRIYRVSEALWGSLDGTYYGGGRTAIDDRQNEDEQSNARLGVTLALSVTRHHSIKLFGSKAIVTRVGGDFDLFGLALQYRWGGGL